MVEGFVEVDDGLGAAAGAAAPGAPAFSFVLEALGLSLLLGVIGALLDSALRESVR